MKGLLEIIVENSCIICSLSLLIDLMKTNLLFTRKLNSTNKNVTGKMKIFVG